ncbi:MAG: hypothetical protein L6Q98_03565 [Anaerolineae bacterium]|nr:hypothetical protein [Anaerolineae bacterium]NUQ02327.1 hypothetical protein [Anaerolineae bacterium]
MMRRLPMLFILMALVAMIFAAVPASAQDCAGSPPPRLVIGDQGRIAQRFSTLRESPAGSPVEVLYAPLRFVVLQGPLCAGYGPLTWYEIQFETGQRGWASEGQVFSVWGWNQYWLELDVQTDS